MLVGWKPAKRRQKDIDATWTKKHGKSHFGYKLSINVDKKYKGTSNNPRFSVNPAVQR